MTEIRNSATIVRGREAEPTTAAPRFPRSNPLRLRRVWITSFVIWTIPAVAFSLLSAVVPEHNPSESMLRLFLKQGLPWYYWALVTPFILSLASKLPLDRAPRARHMVMHACLGLAAGYFFYISWMLVLMTGSPPDGGAVVRSGDLVRGILFVSPFGLGVYATIAAVGYAMHFYGRLRERELVAAELQSQLKEAQLGALRMQLQPHFLFNTLNTIAMLVREGETQTSVRMLARLSDLLRHLLEDKGDQEVPVRDELNFLSRYLEIEQLRFHDRLRVNVRVEEGTRDAFIPNLVLQPIVENAIQHGISRRAAASSIELSVSRENGSLLMSVQDDGPGLSAGFSMDHLTGIGLRNTVARLQYLYGDAATMDVRNAPRQGTVVTLRIPFHDSPMTSADA